MVLFDAICYALADKNREETTMEQKETLGKRIARLRKEKGLTQEQLAEKIGTKKSFISRVEKGRTDIQLSTLVKLFSGLGRQVYVRVL